MTRPPVTSGVSKIEYRAHARNYSDGGKVLHEGEHTLYRGPSYEAACRAWDRVSYNTRLVGGITIQVWNSAGDMVRDGNLLMVDEAGHVYVNPLGPTVT